MGALHWRDIDGDEGWLHGGLGDGDEILASLTIESRESIATVYIDRKTAKKLRKRIKHYLREGRDR